MVGAEGISEPQNLGSLTRCKPPLRAAKAPQHLSSCSEPRMAPRPLRLLSSVSEMTAPREPALRSSAPALMCLSSQPCLQRLRLEIQNRRTNIGQISRNLLPEIKSVWAVVQRQRPSHQNEILRRLLGTAMHLLWESAKLRRRTFPRISASPSTAECGEVPSAFGCNPALARQHPFTTRLLDRLLQSRPCVSSLLPRTQAPSPSDRPSRSFLGPWDNEDMSSSLQDWWSHLASTARCISSVARGYPPSLER